MATPPMNGLVERLVRSLPTRSAELGGLAVNRVVLGLTTIGLVTIQATVLDKEDFARFGLAFFIIVAGPLFAGEVRVSNMRFVAAGDLSVPGAMWYTAVAGVIALGACAAATLVGQAFLPLLRDAGYPIVLAVGVAGGLFTVRDGLLGALAGLERVLHAAMLDTATAMIQLVLLVVLWLVYRDGLTAELAVLALAGAHLTTGLVAARMLANAGATTGARRVKTLGYRAVVSGSNIVQLTTYRIDSFVLASYVSADSLSSYLLVVRMTGFIAFAPAVLNSFIWPRLAKQGSSHSSWNLARRSWLSVSPLTLIIAVVIAIGLHIVAGREYAGVLVIGLLLLPAVSLVDSTKLLAAYISSTSTPRQLFKIACAVLVVSLVLYAVLIPPYGVMGATISSVVAYVMSAVLVTWSFYRLRPAGRAPDHLAHQAS